jgi:hypothetical protein
MPKIQAITREVKQLDNELALFQEGIYKTPQGTVHYDPSMKAKDPNIQAKLADKDFAEWSRTVYRDTVKQESKETKEMLNKILGAIKENTGSPMSKTINEMKDISGVSAYFVDMHRNFKKAFGKSYNIVKTNLLDPFVEGKNKMFKETDQILTDLDNTIVKGMGIGKGTEYSRAVQELGENTKTYAQIVEEFGENNAKKIAQANTWFRSQYDSLLDRINETRRQIYPNNPEKLIPKRSDYYRHFKEVSQGFEGLKNLIESDAGISSTMSRLSQTTQPKTKWLSLAQRRLGLETDVDAVGGFLNYLKYAEYAIHVDPHISKFRALAEELDNLTLEGINKDKVNNFIRYLTNFSNSLAGKSNPLDAPLQEIFGRKAFKILNWANSRVKANVIVGNLKSSVAQFFNIPLGVASAGPIQATKTLPITLKNILTDGADYKESAFLRERYFNSYNKFDKSMIDNAKKLAGWITSIGDEIGTKYIWDMHKAKAIAEGISNPIRYADDMTRSLVAGRGIGEMPLIQQSKVFQLIAPFQLEVTNLWHVMKDFVDEKKFGKFATLFVMSYLMNRGAEKLRGSDVVMDPIQAVMEAVEAYKEEEDKKLGVMRAGGRLAGEIISNVPMGQTVASIYPEYGGNVGGVKLPTRKEFFGEGDPTRFGDGGLLTKGLQDPLYKILPPFGGAQIKSSIEGLSAVNKGYSQSQSGKVQFPIDKTIPRAIQAGAFGKYSVPEAREYFDKKRAVLGDKQSEKVKSASNIKGEYNKIIDDRQARKEKAERRAGMTEAEKKAQDRFESYSIKLADYQKTKDPKAGSSLYYSVKNSKSLTPEMKEELLKSIPVPPLKTKAPKKLKVKAGTRAKKVKKPKKLGKIKVSYKAPKLTKLKVNVPKLAKFKVKKPKKSQFA